MNERQVSVSMMKAAKDHIWDALQTGYSAVLKTQTRSLEPLLQFTETGRSFR